MKHQDKPNQQQPANPNPNKWQQQPRKDQQHERPAQPNQPKKNWQSGS